VAKATSFWFAFSALVANEELMLVLGLGAVAFVTGPICHLWITRMFLERRRDGAPPA
jgi:hypothetical protein